ncbi:hypothetical protein [Nocardioides pantholopis]|uniref:hypothetical protein n=1 Tax=Nocardioides pantholopis TaxID=2483798 RepID=UPI000F07F12D|nr:hypothetical protein [Nocardioides pantholopis]
MISARGRSVRLAVAGVGLVLAGAVLAGCSDDGSAADQAPGASAPPSAPSSGAPSGPATDGDPCPASLPEVPDDQGDDIEPVAETAPSLPAPEEAWACRYDPVEAGPGPGGQGTTWGWELAGAATPVGAEDLAALADHLPLLRPANPARICTLELGPRWMLVYRTGQHRTGVLVDGYGCRDVRLTDDPFTTPAGEATRRGTVPGILTGPLQLPKDLAAVVKSQGHTGA